MQINIYFKIAAQSYKIQRQAAKDNVGLWVQLRIVLWESV